MNRGLRFLFCISIFLFTVTNASFAQAEDVKLSPTITLQIPADLHAQMSFMPSLAGFWFEGVKGSEKFSIWVQRLDAPFLANRYSVKRYWEDGIAQSTANGEITSNQSCNKDGKYAFLCKREVNAPKERFAAERFYWNAKSDLVVVRVMSIKSFATAENIANDIQFKAISRLPASTLAVKKKSKGAAK